MKLERQSVTFEVKEVGETGSFSGYGAVFGNVDSGRDLIVRGAFAQTLAEWSAKSDMPPMLWQHDPRDPIGNWTEMREDDYGLFVRGELATEIPEGAKAYALLKRRAVKGLSIGFSMRDGDWDRDTGVRKLTNVDLMEVSLVTMAMNSAAMVTDVKAAIDAVDNLSDAETVLREAGWSRKDARDFVSRVKRIAQREAGDDRDLQSLLAEIRSARSALSPTR